MLRLFLQGSCSAPVPVGAAQFVMQGAALRSLVNCDELPLPSVVSSPSSAMDSQPPSSGGKSSGGGPATQQLSNGASGSGPGRDGLLLNGYSKPAYDSGKQADGFEGTAGLPNGCHKDIARGLGNHLSAEQSAGEPESMPPREPAIVDGTEAPREADAQQLLGLHPNAAAATAPKLPGIGPLLPAWRSLTEAMAPVVHPVRLDPTRPHICFEMRSVTGL